MNFKRLLSFAIAMVFSFSILTTGLAANAATSVPGMPTIYATPDDSYTTSGYVMAEISYPSNATYMKYSFDYKNWLDYKGPIKIEEDNKTIYAYAKNSAGTSQVAKKVISNIIPDQTYGKVIAINGQTRMHELNKYNTPVTIDTNAETNSQSVTLALSYNFAYYKVAYSDNLNNIPLSANDPRWESIPRSGNKYLGYATTKPFTLTAGNGTKTVYARFLDTNSNMSAIYNDSIVLNTGTTTNNDTTAPVVTATSPANIAANVDLNPRIEVTFNENIQSGSNFYAIGAAGTGASINGHTINGNKFTANVVAPNPNTVYTINIPAGAIKDVAGNPNSAYSFTFTTKANTDTVKPTGSVSINFGAATTNSSNVNLTISGSDVGGSGLGQIRISNYENFSGGLWQETWQPFTGGMTSNWTLLSGDGLKRVYIQIKDNAGNVSDVISSTITVATQTVAQPTFSPLLGNSVKTAGWDIVTINYPATSTQNSYKIDNGTWQIYSGAIRVERNETITAQAQVNNGPASEASYTVSNIIANQDHGRTVAINGAVQPNEYSQYNTPHLHDGATVTTTQNVSLVFAYAPQFTKVAYSENSSNIPTTATDTRWEALNQSGNANLGSNTTKAFTLSAGNGTKTVYAVFLNNAGQLSGIYNDSITLNAPNTDTTVPYGINAVPYNGQTNVDLNPRIEVTFSENILAGNNYSLISLTGNGASLNGQTINGNKFIANAVTPYLNSTYTVNIPAGAFKDAAGNASNGYIFTFTTKTQDVAAPQLTLSQTTQSTGRVMIAVSVVDPTGGVQLKWAEGNQNAAYFASNGNVITANSFEVASNNTYTVYGKNSAGRETVSTIVVTTVTGNQNRRFSDVDTTFWAYTAITEMTNRGILEGFSDGTFRPNDPVTREQFAKILVLSMNSQLQNPSTATFTDVPSNYWAYPYVETAKRYLTGYKAGNLFYYKGNNVAVREDMAVAIVKAKGLDAQTPDYSVLNQYSDQSSISPNLRDEVAIAVKNGLMVGDTGYFRPQGTLTRAEACQLIYNSNLLQREEKVTF